jgi:hypothetical protein
MLTKGFETIHVARAHRFSTVGCNDHDELVFTFGIGSPAGSWAFVTDRCKLSVAIDLAISATPERPGT